MILIIEAQGWCLFARIDHAEHARKKGLDLRPTELVLFGNPRIGTRLMQESRLSAIDLPMKALAWEDELWTGQDYPQQHRVAQAAYRVAGQCSVGPNPTKRACNQST